MATPDYHRWVAASRHWRLARPVAELFLWAKNNGIPVLGTIGDESHLQADFPEDHTPFSYTAWPVPLPGYFVCAIDLADLNGLGSAVLELARQGKLPWLKYMNFAGRSYAFADGFQQPARNSDHHVHISVFSVDLTTSIGDFNPWGVSMQEQLETVTVERPRDGKRVNFLDTVAFTEDKVHKLGTRIDLLDSRVADLVAALEDLVVRVALEDIADNLEVRVKEPDAAD